MRTANYVEETTTSIAGTNGDGAVTLTQITNRPRISSALSTSKNDIRYTIEDTVNKKLETGIGSVTSNVLTRSKVQMTWDGSTWNTTGPTALQFGSSPTSGNIRIRLAPSAENANFGIIDVGQSTIAGDSNWRDYPISNNWQWSNTGSGHTLTADREYYMYYRLDGAGSLSGMQFEVVTQQTSSNLKTALYDIGSDGLPGAKIVDFTTTSTASPGIKTDTATSSWTPAGAVWLTPGWYVIGLISGHAIAIRGFGFSNAAIGRTPLGRKNAYGYSQCLFNSGSYSTGLPASPSLGSATMMDPAGSTPGFFWIGLKVAA